MVGVREIGAAAGLNPALINLYFGSKAGLFREIARDAFGGGCVARTRLAKVLEHGRDVGQHRAMDAFEHELDRQAV